jgi:cell division protein FtsB
MNKKKLIIVIIILILLVVIYFPGFSRLQQLKEENKALEKRISELKEKNEELRKEGHKLQTDPTYLESVAREKLKKAKKGEIIYKVD